MKYSEFLQFQEILEKNHITIEQFKQDPKLYEGILGKIGAGLWDLAKKGMKVAVSKGVSSWYNNLLPYTHYLSQVKISSNLGLFSYSFSPDEAVCRNFYVCKQLQMLLLFLPVIGVGIDERFLAYFKGRSFLSNPLQNPKNAPSNQIFSLLAILIHVFV